MKHIQVDKSINFDFERHDVDFLNKTNLRKTCWHVFGNREVFWWSPDWRGALLESEEEGAGAHDEEQGEVEDSLLPGHHHPSVAAERVLAGQFLPFSHLSGDHHRRHVAPTSVPLRINANMAMGRKFFI